ncbi:hypothetical protein IF1G_00508 [Cordyceps javanica]|uniref:Uncharacterized protein n=1 Tax=Cordyceps javanica TaxID=43265 RepID=A0A545VFT0_9HYPO|nr:hypothetical protein IF1G_00508 [Cordyceps javanica]
MLVCLWLVLLWVWGRRTSTGRGANRFEKEVCDRPIKSFSGFSPRIAEESERDAYTKPLYQLLRCTICTKISGLVPQNMREESSRQHGSPDSVLVTPTHHIQVLRRASQIYEAKLAQYCQLPVSSDSSSVPQPRNCIVTSWPTYSCPPIKLSQNAKLPQKNKCKAPSTNHFSCVGGLSCGCAFPDITTKYGAQRPTLPFSSPQRETWCAAGRNMACMIDQFVAILVANGSHFTFPLK